MREIKFRAWADDKMHYDNFSIEYNGGKMDDMIAYTLEGKVTIASVFALMQYTGLKDKNGTDLDWWEDDLLRKGSDHPCAPIGRIIYDTRKARWVIVGKSGGEFCGLLEAYKNGWKKFGNVHQEQDNG